MRRIRATPFPNRLIPFSILRFGTLTLEPFREQLEQGGGLKWYVAERRDTVVSSYPIGTGLVALPFYLPVVLYLAVRGQTSADELFAASIWSEKLVASAMAAMTVLFVWQLLRRHATERRAAVVAGGLAACTLLWSLASQSLWQHTAGALLLALGAWLLDGQPGAWRVCAAGAVFALLTAVALRRRSSWPPRGWR